MFRYLLFALLPICLVACSPARGVTFPGARLSSASEVQPTILTAYLSKPDGNGPFPAVILLHGCGGIRLNETAWRDWFRTKDIVALSVDSFNPRGVSNICSQLSLVDMNARIADAFGGLDYLAAQPFVDRDRVFIMGFSNGAGVVLAVAAPPSWISRPPASARFRAAIALYPECLTHMSQDDAPPSMPLLILIGDRDDWTLASSCQRMTERFAGKGSPTTLVVLPGARHVFDDATVGVTYLPTAMNINSPSGLGATIGGDSQATERSKQIIGQFLDNAR
jgi:dienelactone hydrolase